MKQSYFPNHRWFPFGLQLSLLHPTLAEIEANHKNDVGRCLQECLTLWLSKADKVTESGGPTLDSLVGGINKIGENATAEKVKEYSKYILIVQVICFILLKIEELSTPACQMLHRHTDKLSPLTLPVEIVQLLYTERVISKETLDEVNRLGGVLREGPLKALCTTVYEDPSKLSVFASVLLKSEETVLLAQDLLKEYSKQIYNKFEYYFFIDQTFPSQINLHRTYQYDFDQMKVTFGNLIVTVSPLIEKAVPSLEELKTYLRKCFRELRPQLSTSKSFDDVMEIVEDKCTIINICCLDAIVNHYNITEAKQHIEEFKAEVDSFCQKLKANVCCDQNFKVCSSSIISSAKVLSLFWIGRLTNTLLVTSKICFQKLSSVWQSLSKLKP